MIATNPVARVLAAPLGSDWTVERLAEQVFEAVVAECTVAGQEFALDAAATADRQSQRVLRPLLACLATKSAAEAGTPPDLYGGRLAFNRPSPDGFMWGLGQFDNRPGMVHVAFCRSASPPENASAATWGKGVEVIAGTQSGSR